MLSLSALVTFAAVVREGDFSAAARSLNRSRQSVHREVARFEEEVGVPLLVRTTRKLRATDAGQKLFVHAERMLDEARRATGAISARRTHPAGNFRVTAPQLLSEELMSPIVARFLERWPDVSIDLTHSLSREDLVSGDFDLALRVGGLDDSAWFSRRLALAETVLVAAPGYIERAPRLKSHRDLTAHRLLHYGARRRDAIVTWRVSAEQIGVSPILTSTSARTIRDTACLGLGIAMLPVLLVGSCLQSGTLIEVLPGSCDDLVPVHAVYASRRRVDPTLSHFLDELERTFESEARLARQ